MDTDKKELVGINKTPHLILILRWLVPGVYALCAFCCLLDDVETHRRIHLAEEIAHRIREDRPANLAEFEHLLKDHIRKMVRVPGAPASPEQNGVVVELTPRLWMHLWVETEPESDRIKDIRLIYAASEAVPIENPREGLPTPATWYWWLVILAFTACPSLVWLRVTREPRLEGFLEVAGVFVATLPLLVVLPFAGLLILRISLWISALASVHPPNAFPAIPFAS